MHYYYDILANFDTTCWEFYEWDEDDEIIALKKVPFFRVSEKVFNDLFNYDITFDLEWIQNYLGKTTIKNIHEKANCLLFSSTKNCLLFEVDKKGHVRYRSKLLLEEENNCNEVAFSLPISNISYTYGKKQKKRLSFRQEEKEKHLIEIELKTLEETKNKSKCSYLYYEWFNKLESDFTKMMAEMKQELKKEYTPKLHEIVLLIKLSYKERL